MSYAVTHRFDCAYKTLYTVYSLEFNLFVEIMLKIDLLGFRLIASC